MPKYSIVIPSYTNSTGLVECIESILKHTNLIESGVEIIVVANGAPEETKRNLDVYRDYPVKLIWFPEPIGYTRASNEGIKTAQGEYVILLNDDCVILGTEWINILRSAFDADPLTAITGPLMLDCPDAGRQFLVFFCVMISREALDSVGILDEVFSPGYGEDCDWCSRAADLGWKVTQVPASQAKLVDKGCDDLPQWKRDKMWSNPFPLYHDGNQTFGKDPVRFDEILKKNKKILRERYNPEVVNTPTNQCDNCGELRIDGICVSCLRKVEDIDIFRSSVTDGWFGVDEAAQLARWVKALPPNSTVVEIGSWHGRSTRAIVDNLSPGSRLFAVDTFNGSSGEPDQHATAKEREGDHCFQWWWDNLHEDIIAGRVIPVRMHSENAAHTLAHRGIKAQLIFVDGDHSAQGIRTDIKAWEPVMDEGGLWCGHDYYKEKEGPWWVWVRQFVEATFPDVEKTATSLWYSRSKPNIKAPVIDCFPFNDELDLLELRFNELDSVVDRWVITESPITHSGQPKPLYFKENMGRFEKWLNKITHIVVDDFQLDGLEGPNKHWAIERHQRSAAMRALTECNDDDIILVGDTDEIPNAEAVRSYRTEMGIACLEMRLFYGYMNLQGDEPWRWTRLLTYEMLKGMGEQAPCVARYNWGSIEPNYGNVIPNGGWHFSFMGGPDEWVRKLEATPHQEYNTPEFKDKDRMRVLAHFGKDILGRDIPYHYVDVDETFPKFVQDNPQRFIDNQFIYAPLWSPKKMHPESWQFVAKVKEAHPEFFSGKAVLEVGSLNVNGTVRQFFDGGFYYGIDLAAGPCVDEAIHVCDLPDKLEFDVVISSEALEHDERWAESLKKMYSLLRPNGMLLITCAGPTRPEHGTKRTDTYSSPFTTDYYRNISQEDFLSVLEPNLFSELTIGYERGMEDLNAYGFKKAETGRSSENPNVFEVSPEKPQQIAEIRSLTVTACVSTKDRYTTTLPLCLSAIINQTRKPDMLVIYDDSENRIPAEHLEKTSPFDGLLRMAREKGIEWQAFSTPRAGQVANHQHCLENASTDFVWRVDDDEIPEPNCLERLLGEMDEDVGAVAGLVHHADNVSPLPEFVNGSLDDVKAGFNIQWYNWNGGPREVDHLYSTFLYRVEAAKKAGGYPRTLSPVGHREETILSHSIKRAGYRLLVTPHAKTWHLREASGGIRSFNDNSLWEHDEQVFQSYLQEWGATNGTPTKLMVLDCGIGDHFAFRSVLPKIREKHAGKELIVACCFPAVFEGEVDLKLISIAEAKQMLGARYDESNLYRHLIDIQSTKPIPEAMLEFWA